MINNKIYGMLGLAARAGKITYGTDQTIEKIAKNKVKLLIIAKDASDRTITKFKDLASRKNIPVYIIADIELLSKSIGKRNKAVVGLMDFNFSKAIIEIIDGGGSFE